LEIIRGVDKMPMYPELMVVPMREELTRLGIEEAKTAEAVDQAVAQTKGTLMVIVNSICGCAAGKMRPAVRMALQGSTSKPDKSISVFAGQDQEATAQARQHFEGQLPSSRRQARVFHAACSHRNPRRYDYRAGITAGIRQSMRNTRNELVLHFG
jgi:putative YphP/YqiW family bacilliredoxin